MKLAPLFALAFVAIVISCSATENVTSESFERAGQSTCTCPGEAQSGSCGKWTCLVSRAGNLCTFDPQMNEGEKCVVGAGDTPGRCFSPSGDPKGALACCPGCVTPPQPLGMSPGVCHGGTEHGYCGTLGLKCDACGPCETCKEGQCVPTSGNACGTCKSCKEGVCTPDEPGEACMGGRCAEGAICCTGCIDGSDQCVSSTDRSCGVGGDRCEDCGQCGSCSSGTCQPRGSGTCDDGDPCTEDDTCGGSGCEGTPVAVDDGNECTDDACSAEEGITHVSQAEGTSCVGSGTSCGGGGWNCVDHDTNAETARICQPAAGLTCFDDDACTSDAPDCDLGVCPYPAVTDGGACTAGLRCVLNESCQSGACVGEARNCSDDNPCTTDTCEEVDGAGVDPVTGCKHASKSASTTCDDGNGCTNDDHCGSDGSCAGTLKSCGTPDGCHAEGSCDPGTGECSDPRLQDGTACENTGSCESGKCVGGTEPGTGGSGGSSGAGGNAGASGAGEGNDAGTASSAAGSENLPSSGGTGGSGTGGDTAGAEGEGTPFKREPGGCSCRVGGDATPAGYSGLALLGGIALMARRRRRAA